METNDKALALYFTRFTNRLILKEKMYFHVVLTRHNTQAFAFCPTVDDLDRLATKVHSKSVDCLFLR